MTGGCPNQRTETYQHRRRERERNVGEGAGGRMGPLAADACVDLLS